MPYDTFHKQTGAHHDVFFDVLSDCPFDGMHYYTFHKHTGAHHYVFFDVLLDCSVDRMPYYKFHKHMVAHPDVYQRNIRIQHCVHEAVHSNSPVKNTV